MAGSGTTLVIAKRQGHRAIGFDTDPMAVLLAKAWCLNVREDGARRTAAQVLKRAVAMMKKIRSSNAYPCLKEDVETRAFVRYWFDTTNRRQLTVLSKAIQRVKDEETRTLLWCAFSRMIITKQASVSLAMDLSHSRPHRVRDRSDVRPFGRFLSMVEAVIAAAPFKNQKGLGQIKIRPADARKLPLPSASIDLVITSPPYLNAIDYLRCHKFSLIWMGYSIEEVRELRAANIGSEVGLPASNKNGLARVVKQMIGGQQLLPRYEGMLNRYVADMHTVIGEIARVLVPRGKATFVIGNSTLGGVYVKNSRAVSILGMKNGLRLVSAKSRILPNNRRYLPPPSHKNGAIYNRMRTETVVTFLKPSHEANQA